MSKQKKHRWVLIVCDSTGEMVAVKTKKLTREEAQKYIIELELEGFDIYSVEKK